MIDKEIQELKGVTLSDIIERWNNGDEIILIKMGGMSDGYERAIHRMAFVILEYMHKNPFDAKNEGDDYIEQYFTEIGKDEGISRAFAENGASGAQTRAAKNEAFMFYENGYYEGLKLAPQERMIKISKGK